MTEINATQAEEYPCSLEELELIRGAYQNAFGRSPDERNIRFDQDFADCVEIDGIAAIHKGLTMVEQQSILGTRSVEQTVWFVDAIKWYPATRHEPEDVDYTPVSTHNSLADAIGAAFGLVVQQAVRHLFEARAMEAWHEEQKAECPF